MSQIPDDFPDIDWTVPADPQEITQLRSVAQWPLWEKLEWLESAQIMVETMDAYRNKQARLARENQESKVALNAHRAKMGNL